MDGRQIERAIEAGCELLNLKTTLVPADINEPIGDLKKILFQILRGECGLNFKSPRPQRESQAQPDRQTNGGESKNGTDGKNSDTIETPQEGSDSQTE